MKFQTFLRSSLLIPYLLWGFSAIIVVIMRFSINTSIDSGVINALALVAMIYAYGIILWSIPYTLLALGLWLWSRGRHTQKILKTFALAPLMLAILLSIETLAISINWRDVGAGFSQVSSDFGASVLAVSGIALAYGYFCVGVTAGIHKILRAMNVIKDEAESTPNIINQNTI